MHVVMLSTRLLLLCAFLLALVSANTPCPVCWNFPVPSINCTEKGPYIDGPFAFSLNKNKELINVGQNLANVMQNFDPQNWVSTQQAQDYHLSINYLYCLPKKYTNAIHVILSSFEWKSFDVKLVRPCCATDGQWSVQMCVSKESQEVLVEFSRNIRELLNSRGIPLENHQDWQPYYHVTVGQVTTGYNMIGALNSSHLPAVDMTVHLNTIGFQSSTYYSSDYKDDQMRDTHVLAGILFMVVVIVFMCWCVSRRRSVVSLRHNYVPI